MSQFRSPRKIPKPIPQAISSTTTTGKIKFKDLIQFYDKVAAYRAHSIRQRHKKFLEDMSKEL